MGGLMDKIKQMFSATPRKPTTEQASNSTDAVIEKADAALQVARRKFGDFDVELQGDRGGSDVPQRKRN